MSKSIVAGLLLLISFFALAEGNNEATDEEQIKSAYSAYMKDFIADDFKGIADKFTYPATFKIRLLSFIPLNITMDNKEQMSERYRALKADIQEGYAYSTIDQITIEPIEGGYVADVIYSRFNAEDELIITGRGNYSYENVNGSWKMYAVEPIND